VGLLGIAFITLKHSAPVALAGWMQRLIGLTLLILAGYVLSASLIGVGPMGRGAALANIIDRIRRWMRKEDTPSLREHGPTSSLSLGVLYGIGAETPTQLTVLMLAANLGGVGNGILALATFAMGMFVSNMALITAATSVFMVSRGWPEVARGLAVLTAAYSLWIGIRLMAN
jgi:high-affinity nickel-transport protein